MRTYLLASLALATLACGTAQATVIATASLYQPMSPSGTTTTVVGVQSASVGSATYTGTGYTISFASVGANQGIVQGFLASYHALPVAGVTSNGAVTYLMGDFGSGQTTDPAGAGKYLSAGSGIITITFSMPQTSLALLWGSIDAGNQITFNDATHDTLTGAQVQNLAAGFAGNGYQGAGGSAHVIATTSTTFTSVMLTSGVVSFEAAGIAASTAPFSLPEPASLMLLGVGLVGAGMARRFRTN